MDHELIRRLAEKYYDGLTSEEEEAQLMQYLSDPSLPLSLRAEYGYLAEPATLVPEPSGDFSERLDALTRTATGGAAGKRLVRYALRIAAAITLIIASYFLADYLGDRRMKDTYSDPLAAMTEIKSILVLVSENMNAGREELRTATSLGRAPGALQEVDRMNRTLEENLGKLQDLRLLDITTKEN